MNLCRGCTECCKGSLPLNQIDYDKLPEHLRSTIELAPKEFIDKFGYLISKPVFIEQLIKKIMNYVNFWTELNVVFMRTSQKFALCSLGPMYLNILGVFVIYSMGVIVT